MTDKVKDEVGFEAALAELEAIVKALEEGKLPLDDALGRFERGLSLLKTCRSRLDAAELRVRELLERDAPDEDGQKPL